MMGFGLVSFGAVCLWLAPVRFAAGLVRFGMVRCGTVCYGKPR